MTTLEMTLMNSPRKAMTLGTLMRRMRLLSRLPLHLHHNLHRPTYSAIL